MFQYKHVTALSYRHDVLGACTRSWDIRHLAHFTDLLASSVPTLSSCNIATVLYLGQRRHCLLEAREALHSPSKHGAALPTTVLRGGWLGWTICVECRAHATTASPLVVYSRSNSLVTRFSYWLPHQPMKSGARQISTS